MLAWLVLADDSAPVRIVCPSKVEGMYVESWVQ
jgi:hypothetical protein